MASFSCPCHIEEACKEGRKNALCYVLCWATVFSQQQYLQHVLDWTAHQRRSQLVAHQLLSALNFFDMQPVFNGWDSFYWCVYFMKHSISQIHHQHICSPCLCVGCFIKLFLMHTVCHLLVGCSETVWRFSLSEKMCAGPLKYLLVMQWQLLSSRHMCAGGCNTWYIGCQNLPGRCVFDCGIVCMCGTAGAARIGLGILHEYYAWVLYKPHTRVVTCCIGWQ